MNFYRTSITKIFFWTAIVLLCGQALAQKAPGGFGLERFSGNHRVKTEAYSIQKHKGLTFEQKFSKRQMADTFGATHQRSHQTFQGVPVYGAGLIKTQNSDGNFTIGRVSNLKNINTMPTLSQDEAMDIVRAYLPRSNLKAELVIYPSDRTFLVWHIDEQAFGSRWQVFVDAHNGRILNAFNKIMHGTGDGVLGDPRTIDTTQSGNTYEMVTSDGTRSTYTAKNRSRLPGTLMTDSDDVWTDPSAVDAHFFSGKVKDFYMAQFGRNSWDDNGAHIRSTVHYQRNYVNAFWNGSQMVYGDGDGVNSISLAGGFDVVAHEITHAVTETTSNLIYQDESGALNEAFSDIMAAAAEYYVQPNDFDWMVGEDIWLADTALRYMDDPTRDGSSSDYYADRYTGTSDNGGVHWNSGIANLAFYLATAGGTHPTYGGSYTGVGMDVSSEIFYTAFTQYLTSSATFADARAACELVAANYSQSVQDSIAAAWEAVGVQSGGVVTPPTPTQDIVLSKGESFSSDHPYADNSTVTWVYTETGANSVSVTFTTLDMERNYDYVYVLDGSGNTVASFTSKLRKAKTVSVSGDTFKVKLVSDQSVTKYGFDAVVN